MVIVLTRIGKVHNVSGGVNQRGKGRAGCLEKLDGEHCRRKLKLQSSLKLYLETIVGFVKLIHNTYVMHLASRFCVIK